LPIAAPRPREVAALGPRAERRAGDAERLARQRDQLARIVALTRIEGRLDALKHVIDLRPDEAC
jgi:hypothetical protein